MDEGSNVFAVEIKNVKERQRDYETTNAKEHDDMTKRLDKIINEALKRWPAGVGIALSILSAICGGLAVWTFTHAPK